VRSVGASNAATLRVASYLFQVCDENVVLSRVRQQDFPFIFINGGSTKEEPCASGRSSGGARRHRKPRQPHVCQGRHVSCARKPQAHRWQETKTKLAAECGPCQAKGNFLNLPAFLSMPPFVPLVTPMQSSTTVLTISSTYLDTDKIKISIKRCRHARYRDTHSTVQ
jgi:hypothetical protein